MQVADDYMVKPFDFRELNARIKVLLKEKQKQLYLLLLPKNLPTKTCKIDTNRREVMRQGSLIAYLRKNTTCLPTWCRMQNRSSAG